MSDDRTVRGRVAVHPRGFGFLRLEERDAPTDSAFVAPRELDGLLAGDVVSAQLVEERDGRFRARKLQLVERWREELFGAVVVEGGRKRVRIDPRVGNATWLLDKAPKSLAAGEAVVGRLDEARLVYARRVSAEDAAREAVLVNWGIRTRFPPSCAKAARGRGARLRTDERRDLRDLPTLTIDGPTSRDLDDALSALPAQPDGAIRVLVHIADVDALVPEGSALDREARRRGTSVYLPGQVIPMLPRALSEDRLSLNPDQERGTLTVELRVATEGAVTAVDLYESVIRSDARLTYDGAAAFLERGDPADVPEPAREPLRWLRAAAARVAEVRAGRGGVDFDGDEVVLDLDAEGEPIGVHARGSNSAHQLIERLMVAANEAVARWLHERGLPAVYRVQDAPASDRVAEFCDVARNFGFEAGFGPSLTPRALAAFDHQLAASSVAPLVRTVVRRLLGRARYQVDPAAHFALGAPLYLHFTSPIRRYADLLVHRVIKAHLRGDRTQSAHDPRLTGLAAAQNELAYRATKAEQERTHCLLARLYAGRIGQEVAGRVVDVRPFGLVIQLAEDGVTGTVPIDTLPGGAFTFDARNHRLSDGKSRSYAVGDPLDLKVAAADEALGRIEFEPRQRRRRRRKR